MLFLRIFSCNQSINNFFKDQEIVVLTLDPKKLSGVLKYERSDRTGMMFPHLYADHIFTNAILSWETIKTR